MNTDDLFIAMLKKALGLHNVRTVGVGIATDVTEQHCTVTRDGAPDLYDVRFHSVTDQLQSSITVIPKSGSYVMFALIDNSATDAVVINCSEIEKTVVKIGQTVHEISDEGHKIEKGPDNMKALIASFISEVQKIIVVNGRSPNVAALEQIKQKFNNLLY
jgi:hypothetical protein